VSAAAIKACSRCGRRYTREQWQALPRPGTRTPEETALVEAELRVEMRDCRCGGTMVVDHDALAMTAALEVHHEDV
jgi:hypothetical protein